MAAARAVWSWFARPWRCREPTDGGYMGSLTGDPAFLATTFVVIDFETTTPAGHPAQPVEVAALALRYRHGAWARAAASHL